MDTRNLLVFLASLVLLLFTPAPAHAQTQLDCPASFSASCSCTRVTLNWSSVPFADEYVLYRTTTPTFSASGQLNSPGTPFTTYQDETVAPGVTYYYWLIADAQFFSASPPCGPEVITFHGAPATPGTPTASDDTSCSAITVTWPAAARAESYEVSRNGAVIASTTGLGYTDAGLDPGRTYSYRVRALNPCCSSALSASDSGSTASPPSTPTGVSASDGTPCGGVAVSWNAVAGAVAYDVFRGPSSGSTGLVATVVGTSWTDNGVVPGDVWFYRVRANSALCSGSLSSANSGFVAGTPPIPTGLVATHSGACAGVRLSWSSSSAAVDYRVWRSGPGSPELLIGSGQSPFLDLVPGVGPWSYRLQAVGACGGVSGFSSSALLDPVVAPPVLVAQPAAQAVCAGSPATFIVGAQAGPVSYQWRRDGQPLGGATTSSLLLADVQAVDQGTYDCVVTNACGSTTSAGAALSLLPGPVVTLPPADATVCEGAAVTFSVGATGAGALTYQWRRDGVDLPGETTDQLSIAATTTADGGTYTVLVGDAGVCSLESPAATLTVETAPVIVVQPAHQSACPGAPVVFEVSDANATGYQWFRDGVPLHGEVQSFLLLGSVGAGDAGFYSAELSNACGVTQSDVVELFLLDPPSIVTQPSGRDVCEGEPFSLSAAASGSAPLAFQWLLDGVPIPGAIAGTFTVTAAVPADAGSYTVEISNACGLVASSAAQVQVQPDTSAFAVAETQKLSAAQGGLPMGPAQRDRFGAAVAALGDLNADGTPDLLVGGDEAEVQGDDTGAVWVLLRAPDGSVTAQTRIAEGEGGFSGALSDGDRFGAALCSLGDLDGDGVTDVAVGAWGDNDGGNDSGAVWVLFLRSDGSVRAHSKIGALSGGLGGALDQRDRFGRSLAPLGDLDGDGRQELLVGAEGDDDGANQAGAVWLLYLNADGSVRDLRKLSATSGGFAGTLASDHLFGAAVAGLGDLDADGIPEVAVAAPGDDRGAVWVLFMRADGTVGGQQRIAEGTPGFVAQLQNRDDFASSLAALGDFDGDGCPDLAVGSPGDNEAGNDTGAVWVLLLAKDAGVRWHYRISGTEGQLGATLDDNDRFAGALAGLGDIDGDGRLDLAVGASGDDDGANNAGAAYVLRLQGPCSGREIERLGSPANPAALLGGVTGPPIIGAPWRPVITAFEPGGTLAFLTLSLGQANVPTPFGTLLCTGPAALQVFQVPGEPFLVPIPFNCNLVGAQVCAQGGLFGPSFGIRLTGALDLSLGDWFPGAELFEPPLANPINGHLYFRSRELVTFEEAVGLAERLAGDLLTISDQAEQDWMSVHFGSGGLLWLGMRRINFGGPFAWLNGEPLVYTNWCTGEPNGPTTENFAVMNWGAGSCWNDVTGSSSDRFRCIVELAR